jgi:hypothetical protein
MTLKLCGPSLWITINPNDLHNPIAQIFIGEEIDMDKFLQLQVPTVIVEQEILQRTLTEQQNIFSSSSMQFLAHFSA